MSDTMELERSHKLHVKVVLKANPEEGGANKMVCGKSDAFIVVKKPGNAGGAKGSE